MIYPPPISKGDCIGLAAPASPISREERDACVRALEKLGFGVKLAKGLVGNGGEGLRAKGQEGGRDTWHPWYLAGDARQRADDLNQMFHDPRIRAVFCVRGGYGSAGLLPYLDYRGIRQNPKVFVGYSDITAVHMALQKQSGLVTFHGPMVKSDLIGEPQPCQWQRLWDMVGSDGAMADSGSALFRNPEGEEIGLVAGQAREGQRGQRIRGCRGAEGRAVRGRLVGGNLSVFAGLAGTGYLPDLRGKLLFLEDVNETVPRIHMKLLQLEQMGAFRQVQGILLGGFTGCGQEAEELLDSFFGGSKVPVLKNICSDHRKDMGTLPLGAFCELQPGERKIIFSRYDRNRET